MEKSKKLINEEGGFLFWGGWNFSKLVNVGSTFIREMRVQSLFVICQMTNFVLNYNTSCDVNYTTLWIIGVKKRVLIARYFVTRQVLGSSNFQWTRSYQITPLCNGEIISRQPSFLVQKMKWQKVFQPRGSIRSLLPRASFSCQLRFFNCSLGKEWKSLIVSENSPNKFNIVEPLDIDDFKGLSMSI